MLELHPPYRMICRHEAEARRFFEQIPPGHALLFANTIRIIKTVTLTFSVPTPTK